MIGSDVDGTLDGLRRAPDAKSAGEAAVSTFDRFVADPLLNLWESVVAHLPAVATGLVVLITLLIIAHIIRAAIGKVLSFSRLDKAMAETRIATILQAFQKDLLPSKAVAYLVYFAVVLVAWTTAADIVGLPAVRDTLEAVLGYLPYVVSALLVLAIGGYLASLARRAVSAVLDEVESPYSSILAGLTEFILLVVVGTIAIESLGADMTLVTSNVTIIVAVVAVTIGFLFCWSMRRPAEEVIANYYVRRMVTVGETVEIQGIEGQVRGFAPIGILLTDADGIDHFVPAKKALEGVRRIKAAEPRKSKRRRRDSNANFSATSAATDNSDAEPSS